MRAQVEAIQFNQTDMGANGEYNYTKFVTKGVPYEGKEQKERVHRIFDNNPLLTVIEDLKEGDMIEYTVDNTKFKNIKTIKYLGGKDKYDEVASGNKKSGSGKSMKPQTDNSDETTERIARSVALRHATVLMVAMLAREGLYNFVVAEVDRIARGFEPYLLLKDNSVNEEPEESKSFED
jgi:hypothetical protein